jgi:amino acid adenylation domain-containing protein
MENFIVELEQSGLTLSVRNGDLILSGKKGKLTTEEIAGIQRDNRIPAFIKEHKAALVQYISSRNKITSLYELSPLQEGILFHSLYAGSATAYITQFRLDFPDGLNIAAFRQAWQYVINNHSILRTAFVYDKVTIPLQSVYAHVELPFALLDFSQLTLSEQQRAFDELLHSDRLQGFDLGKAPLTRVTIVKTGAKACRMIWTKHHILWDGWSGQVIISEVLKAYEQYAKGHMPPVVAEDLFQDYIKYINAIDPVKEKQFWETYMKGLEAPTLLPFVTGNNERNKGEGNFKHQSLIFDREFSQQIYDYTQRYHVTAYTMVQGIWALLLSVYNGTKDIVFGATVSGRPADIKYDKKVGLYINTLPFRARVDDKLTVTDWLLQLQKEHVRAREYQYTALTKIQKWTGVSGDLFDSIIVFRNFPLTEKTDGGEPFLKIENVEVAENNNYLLSVQASLHQQLIIDFNYNSSLLEDVYPAMIKEHFRFVFEQVIAHPFAQLSAIKVLTPAEESELLTDFNDTDREYAKESTVVSLFEEQVALRPDDVALVTEHKQLTYAMLNAQADQLARRLAGHRLTGICMERSADMVVAMLAVLKAGSCFIPIDPAYPKERVDYILSDSQADLLITDQGLVPVVAAESLEPGLAYVIYTSGSTGNPKGVMIEQTALVNFLGSMRELLGFTAAHSILAVTTCSFDIAYLELFLPLITGGKVVLAGRTAAMDGYLLKGLLATHRPTHMQATPATWQLLLDSGWRNEEEIIILTGGEAIKDILKDTLTGCSPQVWNLFGPTETTIWSAIKELHAGEQVLIGKPIHNTRLYIVDEQLQLVPVGVKGELCISGDGLARGYLHRPELTREKFVETVFCKRLYRTGDLARWRPDGNVEYLDRKDNQVKIRGYRVETGEIENVLQQCAFVSKNAVIAREDTTGTKKLIAYIVPAGVFNREGILEFLKAKLPAYMVPSLLVNLDALPMTANGKTDRKRLPDPGELSMPLHDPVPPRNDIEIRLEKIWKQLLALDKVGVYDNFFEMGGHSLLAMRVVAAIRRDMDIEVVLKDLFDHPTIDALARLLQRSHTGLTLPGIVKFDRPARLPLSFSQERLWFIDKLGGSMHYHIAASLRLKGDLDIQRLCAAFKAIVHRHEVLRTVIRDDDGIAYQLVLPAENWELSEGSIHDAFDLSADYMLRVKLTALSAGDYRLEVVMHHIAADGWSVSVLIREMVAMYQGAALPPLPVQYADYALWQRQYLAMDDALSYWTGKLTNTATLNLPLDHPRPAVAGNDGDVCTLKIDGDLARALKELAQGEGATLFMVLLSAFKLLLFRYSGDTDICVGTPVANRTHSETESLIGFFINTLALRTTFDANYTLKQLIALVKETTLDAYAHQQVPFEKILDAVKPGRYLDRSPLFQVFFNMMNQPHEEMVLDGLSIHPEVGQERESKFDITLYAQEISGGIAFRCLYKTALFDRAFIEVMLAQYVGLLKQAVKTVDKPLRTFSLQTTAGVLLPLSAPGGESVIDLIARHAYTHPGNLALQDNERTYTYGELWDMSSAVAVYLQQQQIGKEDIVALYGERNALLPVILLGILKAGACFCILSKDLPAARTDYYLSVLHPKMVLDIQAIRCSDYDHSLWKPVTVAPDNAAYCVFTSGSTGVPKLVVGCHGSLVNYVYWIKKEFAVGIADHYSMLSGLQHDPLMRDIFVALCIGGRLMIPTQALIGSPQLADWLKAARVTMMNLTPSLARTLKNSVVLDDLRYVFYGGEPLKTAALLHDMAPGVVQVCLYGTTESQQALGYYIVPAPQQRYPLGKGVLNTELLVVDASLEKAGVGELGEIAIRSHFLARGYKKDVLLTDKKFVHTADGVRMYLTGDMGRYDTREQIFNAGRADNQVKIRGYRIALEEVEQALLKYVSQAVVAVREDSLVAYVVGGIDKKQLKELLSGDLPAYMVPAYIVGIAQIPLTANKKVDRKALPDVTGHDMIRTEHIAPETDTEKLLATIWKEVLAIEEVSVTDNFYELGGNSLKSVQVVAQLKNKGFILPVVQILKTPFIRDLAVHVKLFHGTQFSTGEGITKLTPSQLRYFNGEEYRHVSGSFRITLKHFDRQRWLDTLRKAYAALDVLRTRIFKTPDGLRQMFADTIEPVVIYIRDEELEAEKAKPFDLENGQGMRCYITGQGIVYFTIHHALTDDISNRLIAEYLQQTYEGKTVAPLLTLYDHHADATQVSPQVQPVKREVNVATQVRITGQEYQDIIAYCQAQHITISSFMLSLIYRQLGTGSFTIDVIVDGRAAELPARAIGQFTKKIPLCIEADESSSFDTVCKIVHANHLEGRVPVAQMKNTVPASALLNYRDLQPAAMPAHKPLSPANQEYFIAVKCDTYVDGLLLEISAPGNVNIKYNPHEQA